MPELSLAIADDVHATELPSEAQFQRWVDNTLTGLREEAVVDIAIVGESQMREMNHHYRGRDYPTNVLAFPADLPPGVELPLLGDLAICAPVIRREAAEQNKPQEHHWAHMITHGLLHLLGYDHIDEADAARMEAAEREILARLDIPDPYGANGSFAPPPSPKRD